MSTFTREVEIINTIGRAKAILIIGGMRKDGTKAVEFFKYGMSYCPDYNGYQTNRENIYSVEELELGLTEHTKIIKEKDKIYEPNRQLFEPVAKKTEFLQKRLNDLDFEFFDGKYNNEFVQALFEMFTLTRELKDGSGNEC